MAGHKALDAYVSYDVRDATWVRVLAGRLFDNDLEVFGDPWDDEGRDVLPLRLAQGSRRARRTILVLGPELGATPWVSELFESFLAGPAVPDRPPVILVHHGGVELPGFAAGHLVVDFGVADPAAPGPAYETRAYQDRIEDLVRLLGPAPGDETRAGGGDGSGSPGHELHPDLGGSRGSSVSRAPRPGDRAADRMASPAALLRVTANRVTCTLVHTTAPGSVDSGGDVVETSAAVTVDGHRFSALLWSQQRHDSEALRAIGTALGATFTPDPVGRMLEDAASVAYERGATLSIGIATGEDLGDLPWETLILPGHNEPLALHPAIRVYRVHEVDPDAAAEPDEPLLPVPGPLRILVIIAGPAGGSLVDYERELAALMDAVEPARKYHGVRVNLLNEGTLPAVRDALAREPFHVLHISGHARPGALVLEDADGQAAEVTAEALWEAMPAGRRVPLIVLSGCWTAQSASGTEPLSGLAGALVAAGVPQVVAMTAPVTDRYAVALCADLYRELALAADPDVLTALAHARRAAEERRLAEVAGTGRTAPAEWATPALFVRGQLVPLYDPALPSAPRSAGPFPQASPPSSPRPAARSPRPATGEFVGRRDEVRRLVAALRDPDSPGVVLHGIGGVGKSAVAAEAVRRLGSDAGVVAFTTGTVTVDKLRRAIERASARGASGAGTGDAGAGGPGTGDLGTGGLGTSGMAAEAAGAGIPGGPALLVIDGMEANLVRAGDDTWGLADPRIAAFLSDWVSGPRRGRLLLTSRHPFELPGVRRLYQQHVGPLSWSEARKLIWRLRALDTLSLNDQQKSYVDTGGHPHTLLILDALLRRPGAAFAELRQRMERLLRDRKIDRPELWMAQVGKDGMDASLAEAVALAVHRGLLADLLAALDEPVRAVLLDAAWHRGPIPEATLLDHASHHQASHDLSAPGPEAGHPRSGSGPSDPAGPAPVAPDPADLASAGPASAGVASADPASAGLTSVHPASAGFTSAGLASAGLASAEADRAGAAADLERSALLIRIHTDDGVSFVVDTDTTELLASTYPDQTSRGLSPTS